MNTLAKVFVVANLVLAAGFCFTSLTLYAKRVDYKAKLEAEREAHRRTTKEFEEKVSTLEKSVDALSSELEFAKRDLKEMGDKFASKEEELRTTQIDLLTRDKERRVLLARNNAKDQELRRSYDQITRMHTLLLGQQKAVEVMKENLRNATNLKIEMENELNSAKQQLVAVQKEKVRLEGDLEHHSWILETLIKHGVPVRDIVYEAEPRPVEPIHAKVLAVRPDVNIVMLSVGTDDKVQAGYRFTVYRGSQYVGRVEVEKVFADMCSARILSEYTKEPLREGDDASTRVYD